MLDPKTRPSLIIRLADRADQSAWWSFVETYEPFLNHLVSRQGVPPAHVADVTQQVLIAIAKGVARWRDDGQEASFRRWVCHVARNVVIKFMTQARRVVTPTGGSEALDFLHQQEQPFDPAAEQKYEYELIVWAAERVRAEFAASSWQAFWDTMIQQRSVTEVAKELGISPGSIYMSRSRIIKRLREIIAEVMQ
jgi:RNA polymerase sigma-70 factor, ECF subfamily